jgi:uridine kinase
MRPVLRDVEERGRDIEGVIKQWFAFVKPNFETYVEPQRKVAGKIMFASHILNLSRTDYHSDIIVPRGVKNRVAISKSVLACYRYHSAKCH